MRNTRQVNEVPVQIPNGRFTSSDRARIEAAFNAKYEEMYGAGAGHAEAGIEGISIAVDAIGATVKPKLRAHPVEGPDASAARKSARRASSPPPHPPSPPHPLSHSPNLTPPNL